MKKKKAPTTLFIIVFAGLAVLVVVQNVMREKTISLSVADNHGVSVLESIDNSLIGVFQDGRVGVWEWKTLPAQKGDFKALSDRAIILDPGRLAAMAKEGKRNLTIYALPSGQKQKEISVGWQDQEVWPRISCDKKGIALIRRNPVDSAGKILYEFLTVDIEKELLGPAVAIPLAEKTEAFVDFAAAADKTIYVVGSRGNLGRIAKADLEEGKVVWDTVYDNTKEFCSVMISPEGQILYAGNRDGILYKLNAQTGEMLRKIQLLEAGETRPITNDYSVLNLAFSPDGNYYVATIHPKAYFLKTVLDEIFYTCTPANKLVSKIAFSPDNRSFATSDIRAGYPVKIWPMPEENKQK